MSEKDDEPTGQTRIIRIPSARTKKRLEASVASLVDECIISMQGFLFELSVLAILRRLNHPGLLLHLLHNQGRISGVVLR